MGGYGRQTEACDRANPPVCRGFGEGLRFCPTGIFPVSLGVRPKGYVMPGDVRLIPTERVKVTKSWGGGLNYAYRCPKCKDQLSSSNEQVLQEDTCPTCSTTFAFGQDLQAAWVKYQNQQRQEEEEKKQAREQQRRKVAEQRAAAALEPSTQSLAITTRRGLPGRSYWHGWVRSFH